MAEQSHRHVRRRNRVPRDARADNVCCLHNYEPQQVHTGDCCRVEPGALADELGVRVCLDQVHQRDGQRSTRRCPPTRIRPCLVLGGRVDAAASWCAPVCKRGKLLWRLELAPRDLVDRRLSVQEGASTRRSARTSLSEARWRRAGHSSSSHCTASAVITLTLREQAFGQPTLTPHGGYR